MKRRDFKQGAISDYLDSKQIPIQSWSPVLSKIVELDLGRYGNDVTDTIEKYFDHLSIEESQFIGVLESFAKQREKRGPNYLWFLTDIPTKENISAALKIYEKIKSSEIAELRICSGYLLGAIGYFMPDMLFEEINTNKTSNDPYRKVSYIHALKIAYNKNNRTGFRPPESILDLVIESASSSEPILRNESIIASLFLYNIAREKIEAIIKILVDESDSNKMLICNWLWLNDLSNNELELWILKKCGESESVDVISYVLSAMDSKIRKGINTQKVEIYALDLLKKWSLRGAFFRIPTRDLLEDISGANINYALDYFDKWISEENDNYILQYIIPKILGELFTAREQDLVMVLDGWKNRDHKYLNVCLWTFKEIMKEIDGTVDHEGTMVFSYVNKANQLLEKKGIEVKYIMNDDKKSFLERTNEYQMILESLDTSNKFELEESKLIDFYISRLSAYLASMRSKAATIELIFHILIPLATQRGLDIDYIKKGISKKSINDKVIDCYKIIDTIRSEKKILDCKTIKKNLHYFPNIHQFIKERWFYKKCRENNPKHNLPVLLSEIEDVAMTTGIFENQNYEDYIQEPALSNQFRSKAFLEHLDRSMEVLNKQQHGRKLIIDALKDDENFYQTLSELEIASAIDKKYPVDLQQLINGKRADIIIRMNNAIIIFEIISPDVIDRLKYIGFAANIKNKARKIIEDKINDQVTRFAMGNNNPILLIIDKSRAYDISSDDIHSALEGSYGLILATNEKTGKVDGTKWIRKNDAVGLEVKDGHRLAAVIFYGRSYQTRENHFKLQGEIIVNPFASSKLDDDVLKGVEDALFG